MSITRLLSGVAVAAICAAVAGVLLISRPLAAPGGGVTPRPTASDTGKQAAVLVPLAPAAEPKPLDRECSVFRTTVDELPLPATAMARDASTSIVGTIVAIGPAQWNTRDGLPPSAPADFNAEAVLRLIRVDVSQQLAGAMQTGLLTVWIPGGSIGCHTFVMDGYPLTPAVGDKFAFFLQDKAPAAGISSVLRARAMWPIGADGLVTTPAEGKLTVDQLATAAAK